MVNCILEEKIYFYDGNNHLFLNTFKGYVLVSHSYNRKKQCDRKEEVETEIQLQQKYSHLFSCCHVSAEYCSSLGNQTTRRETEGRTSVSGVLIFLSYVIIIYNLILVVVLGLKISYFFICFGRLAIITPAAVKNFLRM